MTGHGDFGFGNLSCKIGKKLNCTNLTTGKVGKFDEVSIQSGNTVWVSHNKISTSGKLKCSITKRKDIKRNYLHCEEM